MEDPLPENIAGEKVQTHTFEHRVNWGYVAVAVAVLFVVLYVDPLDRSDDDESGSIL